MLALGGRAASCLWLTVWGLVVWGWSQPAAAAVPEAQALHAMAERWQADRLPAEWLGAVQVWHGERRVFERARGVDRGGLAVDADTLFWIGSISKHLAAVALLDALQGRTDVGLQTPVAAWFPELAPGALARDGEHCTIERLLSHQCGLPRDARGFRSDPHRSPAGERELLEGLNARGLRFTPGSRFEYTNTGYNLAGVLVSRLTGRPYHEVLAQRLVAPRGLHGLGGTQPLAPLADRFAPGHTALPWGQLRSERLGIPWMAPSWIGASGDAFASARELGVWFRALARGEVLPEPLHTELVTPRRDDYALGLVAEDKGYGRLLWHNGALTPHGHNSFVGHAVASDWTVVVLSNVDLGAASATVLGMDLLEAAHTGAVAPAPSSVVARWRGGLPGAVLLGLPWGAALWALSLWGLGVRRDRGPWAAQCAMASSLWLLGQQVLDGFRPPELGAWTGWALGLLALGMFHGLWRGRQQPLWQPGRERARQLAAAVNALVSCAVGFSLGALGAVLACWLVALAVLWATQRAAWRRVASG